MEDRYSISMTTSHDDYIVNLPAHSNRSLNYQLQENNGKRYFSPAVEIPEESDGPPVENRILVYMDLLTDPAGFYLSSSDY